jgi:hypothetical protein
MVTRSLRALLQVMRAMPFKRMCSSAASGASRNIICVRLCHALLDALLERRESLINDPHQHEILLEANGVECRWILAVQLRNHAPKLRPGLAVAQAATFGDPRDRLAAREGAKDLTALGRHVRSVPI